MNAAARARTKGQTADVGTIVLPSDGLQRKGFHPTRFKLVTTGDDEGSFSCAFAQLNVKDHDGDLTLPGAFKDGQEVRICQWGHNWHALPAGKGTISEQDGWAVCAGQFFLDTTHGLDTYRTVKALGDLQEWSYGFNVLDAERATVEGEQVTLLKALDTFEVSPVLLGAGIGTHTQGMKRGRRSGDTEGSGTDTDAALGLAAAVRYQAVKARLNGVCI